MAIRCRAGRGGGGHPLREDTVNKQPAFYSGRRAVTNKGRPLGSFRKDMHCSALSSEESSPHCIPCGCCNVRMLCPPGLNTPQAAKNQTAANRSTEGWQGTQSSSTASLPRSGVKHLVSLQSNIQEFSAFPGRGLLLLSNFNKSYLKSMSGCG